MVVSHSLILLYTTISYGEIVLDCGLTILYFAVGSWEVLFVIPVTEVCTNLNFSSDNLRVPINIWTFLLFLFY